MHNSCAAFCRAIIILITLSANSIASADSVHVAVASNFVDATRQLARQFESESEHKVLISSASTGKLYAQIINGAPFDLFLSADAARPEKLVAEGLAKPQSLQTYAYGKLLLVCSAAQSGRDCKNSLATKDVRRIAIAEPRIAPYGKAAQEALKALGLWNSVKGKMVRGENIAQALHFYVTGNAQAALIAASQAYLIENETHSYWEVPHTLHAPIEQKMVVLQNGNLAAQAFAAFLARPSTRETIRSFGYLMEQ